MPLVGAAGCCAQRCKHPAATSADHEKVQHGGNSSDSENMDCHLTTEDSESSGTLSMNSSSPPHQSQPPLPPHQTCGDRSVAADEVNQVIMKSMDLDKSHHKVDHNGSNNDARAVTRHGNADMIRMWSCPSRVFITAAPEDNLEEYFSTM
ncbi:unnamed protein product [Urochloa humidicola]